MAGPTFSFRQICSANKPASILPEPVFIFIVLSRRARFSNHLSRTSPWLADGNLKRGSRASVVKICRGSMI